MNIEGVEGFLQLLRDGKTLTVIPKFGEEGFRFLYMDGDEYVVVDTNRNNDFTRVKSILFLRGWLAGMIKGANWHVMDTHPEPTGKEENYGLAKYEDFIERFEAGQTIRLRFTLPAKIECEYEFTAIPPSYSVMCNHVLVGNVVANNHYEVWLIFCDLLNGLIIEVEDA